MKEKKRYSIPLAEISPIFEQKLNDTGSGIFGFTITYPRGRFENIIRQYSSENRLATLIEIEQKRQNYLTYIQQPQQFDSADNQLKDTIKIKRSTT